MEAVVDYIQGDLFRHATEEDTSGMDHMWALGVILYFLLCGYPKLRGANQVECFDNMKIGPKAKSNAWKRMEESGHEFPSRQWCKIPVSAKRFIKDLSHYNPGNRPPITDIWRDGMDWYNEHAITWMSILRSVEVFYDSDNSDERTVPLTQEEEDEPESSSETEKK